MPTANWRSVGQALTCSGCCSSLALSLRLRLIMQQLQIDSIVIEYQVQGDGEPVLLIPPSVTFDGLGLPLLAQPMLASRFQLIHYHRRGYLGSTLGSNPLTIALEAGDAAMLLRHLGVSTAHIVGHSIGGLIGL